MMNKEIAVAWIDLTFKIRPFFTGNEKIILNSLNGSVNFGSLNALMGPSGAGKTTLLKCINGRIKSGLTEGSKIYLNSRKKIRPCFIGQYEKEYLIKGLTAKQNLIYASKLKNSGHSFNIDHEKNALDLLSELMMEDIANNRVEDCSGGEQKRLSIALEMTQYTKPNLLCIDEPTTGLDSNAAQNVMDCLKLLSTKHNIAIITSIHQPNSDILIMFSELYVLAKGGLCVYSGPPQHLKSHLNECQIVRSEYQFPIEVLLKTATNGISDEKVIQLAEKTSRDNQNILIECLKETKLFPEGIPIRSKNFKLIDLWYLMMRTMTQTYISQWKTIVTQMLVYILFPLIITRMFNSDIGIPDGCYSFLLDPNTSCHKQLEDDSILDQNIKFHYFASVCVMFVHLIVTTMTFPSEVKIFLNEHRNGWYSTGVFYISKTIVELLPTLVYSISFAFLSFFSSGQYYDKERLFWYIFIITAGFLCNQGLGFFIGIVLAEYELIAIEVEIALYTFSAICCNIFMPLKEVPEILKLISNSSYIKFVFDSGLIIFYGFGRCTSDQLSIVFFKFDLNDDLFYDNVKYLVIHCLILRIMAFIVFCFKTNTFLRKVKPKYIQNLLFRRNHKQGLIVYDLRQKSVINIQTSWREENKENMFKETISNEVEDKKISFAWIDLTFKVPKTIFSKEKIILRHLNGCVEFGSLNAIMGPSGAGKTSLLRCIINAKYQDFLSNQTQIYLSRFKKIRTCFITQEVTEHLLCGLTVKEALIYASKLKNSDNKVDHENNVKELMNEFLISDIGDTLIVNCSGGEQKRLVLAMEMTSQLKPNLMCIDEPTSGLDSNAAEVVMKCLKSFSRNHNITVITSIHQPNNDLLMMFDKLYVLSKGGLCIYSGPPRALKTHLNQCGINCSEYQFPVEVLLKYACNPIEDKHVIQLSSKTSEEKHTLLTRCSNEAKLFADGIRVRSKRFKIIDFRNLFLRTMTSTIRYFWKLLLLQFILYILLGYFLRFIFNQDIGKPSGCISLEEDFENKCNKTIEKIHEETLIAQNITYNFSVVKFVFFVQSIATTMYFISDVKVFLIEQRNGWYSSGCYYWAKSIVELVPLFVTIISYAYFSDIYKGNTIFFGYLFFLITGILCLQSYGHILGIIFNENAKIAAFLSAMTSVVMMVFSNFFISIKELHYALQWLSNISITKLAFENILILLYGFDRCSDTEFSSVMYIFNLEDNDFYRNTRILIFQLIFLRGLALVAILMKANNIYKRKKAEEKHDRAVKKLELSNSCILSLT